MAFEGQSVVQGESKVLEVVNNLHCMVVQADWIGRAVAVGTKDHLLGFCRVQFKEVILAPPPKPVNLLQVTLEGLVVRPTTAESSANLMQKELGSVHLQSLV